MERTELEEVLLQMAVLYDNAEPEDQPRILEQMNQLLGASYE